MVRRRFSLLSALLALVVFLAACGGAATPTAPAASTGGDAPLLQQPIR